ncbi:GDNF-inducible zinc finger protein 1-like isoform X9 [Trichoplusia ni]|uniref:GDNF-inducible zinc finger protein 1-like isoform X9 n=1 Tax=Trichoplusia ni TaxID=7111 RepID=A0A7E5WUK7_TRINI|nr:GDNF-inducible zinc finger protein 1-like isoform X9 [Trichoplusia ni]
MMEFDEIVVKETPGLCRCCLSEGCYKDLGSEYSWMNETEVYADMLLECFDISITQHNEGPNGPNRLICEVCITRLRDACNFKKQVLDSEKKFIDMMGRGEFRPKMLIYQTQMKAEDAVEAVADDAEVEYLEDDIDFGEEDLIKDETEPSVSDITVSTLPVKGKRGRPRKNALVKPEKRLKTKVDDKKKVVAKDQTVADKMIEERRKEELATLLSIIIENTDIVPFRWHKSKYMCFYCRALFVESCGLKHHTSTEHKEIEIREIIVRSLYRRGRTKLDVTNINCRPCDTEILNFESFLKHLSKIHSLSFETDAAQSFDCFSLADDGMCCLQCGQYFTFFGPLLLHTYKYHIDQFLCEVCGLGFVGKHNVHNHVKQIHKIKSCKDCNLTFQTQYALLNHTENVHKTEKLKCPICPEVLGNRYLKKRHLALVHDCKNSQFVCELCSKIFTRNNKYMQHKLRVHFKEKNVTCEYCGHKAFNMDSLKSHMVCHDETRPFKCELCEKTFRRKKTLVIHMRTHKMDDLLVVDSFS